MVARPAAASLATAREAEAPSAATQNVAALATAPLLLSTAVRGDAWAVGQHSGMGTHERGMGSIRAENLPMTVARLACDDFTTEDRGFPIFGGRR